MTFCYAYQWGVKSNRFYIVKLFPNTSSIYMKDRDFIRERAWIFSSCLSVCLGTQTPSIPFWLFVNIYIFNNISLLFHLLFNFFLDILNINILEKLARNIKNDTYMYATSPQNTNWAQIHCKLTKNIHWNNWTNVHQT